MNNLYDAHTLINIYLATHFCSNSISHNDNLTLINTEKNAHQLKIKDLKTVTNENEISEDVARILQSSILYFFKFEYDQMLL